MSHDSSPPARLVPVAAGWAAVVTGVAIAGGVGADTSSDYGAWVAFATALTWSIAARN